MDIRALLADSLCLKHEIYDRPELEEITALKARIERLENAKDAMASALRLVRRHLYTWNSIEQSLKHHCPSACADIVDAVIAAHDASSTMEKALRTLRDSRHH